MTELPALTVTMRPSNALKFFLGALRLLIAVRVALPEILTALALLGGWALITAGVVALTSPLAWRFSLGLLLLSLGGWKLLYVLAKDGLYTLTRGPANDA